MLPGKCTESVTCGGQKAAFTWHVRGIGHVAAQSLVDVAKMLARVRHSKDCACG